MAKHFMKFAKAVQEEGGVDFTDAQILEMRRDWEPPPAAAEEDAVTSSSDETPAPTTEAASAEKKRGRKPMTEEQKAAARASRETLRESSAPTVPDIEDVPMAAASFANEPAKKKIAAKKPSFK